MSEFATVTESEAATLPTLNVNVPTETIEKKIYEYFINEESLPTSEIWAPCLGAIVMLSERRTASSVLNKMKGLPTIVSNMYPNTTIRLKEFDLIDDMTSYMENLSNKSISESSRAAVELEIHSCIS